MNVETKSDVDFFLLQNIVKAEFQITANVNFINHFIQFICTSAHFWVLFVVSVWWALFVSLHRFVLRGLAIICSISFFFLLTFLGSRTARTEQRIFVINGSKCVFWRKEVPFGGLIDFWIKLGAWGPKNPQTFRHTMQFCLWNKNLE
jgi:hypothetical protein